MLLIALALTQAAPFDTKADFVVMARQYCAAEWPNDFAMQSACLKWQAEGMLKFKAANDSGGKPLEKSLEKCTEEWTKNRVPNWQMIGWCAERQVTAYQELNGSVAP